MQCAFLTPHYISTQHGCLCSVPVCASLRQYLLRTLMQCVCLTPHYVSTQYGRLCSVPVFASLSQYLARTLMLCVCLCLTTVVLSTDAYAMCLFVPDYVSTYYGRLWSVSVRASLCQDFVRTIMQCVCLCLTTLALSTDAFAVCLFFAHYLSTQYRHLFCFCFFNLSTSQHRYK